MFDTKRGFRVRLQNRKDSRNKSSVSVTILEQIEMFVPYGWPPNCASGAQLLPDGVAEDLR